MRMKKILCSLVAGAAILSLAACGNSGGSKKSADSGSSSGKTDGMVGISSFHASKSKRWCWHL